MSLKFILFYWFQPRKKVNFRIISTLRAGNITSTNHNELSTEISSIHRNELFILSRNIEFRSLFKSWICIWPDMRIGANKVKSWKMANFPISSFCWAYTCSIGLLFVIRRIFSTALEISIEYYLQKRYCWSRSRSKADRTVPKVENEAN